MRLRPAPLEDWLRDYYFSAEIDISSSGVEPYSMAELRRMTGLRQEDLDDLVFTDGYSVGALPVREAIAGRWGDGDPDKVMTSSGSSEAIALVLMSLLQPGDEVVVVEPGYHSLIDFAAGLGCKLRTWRIGFDRDWEPSLDELSELVHEGTRAIILNFPQNPTGTTITEKALRRIVTLAESVGAYLLWDAAFADLTYDTAPLPDVSGLYSRGISFGTFSKAFGLPGLRFGWCVAPPDVLAKCVRIRDYTTLHVAPIIELLALEVLRDADSFLGPRFEQARTNRGIVQEWAAAHPDLVSLVLPAGGVASFPQLLGHRDTDAFCDDLFRRQGVLVIPGSCFGEPRHIRLGFGGPTPHLLDGLSRLTDALQAARPKSSGQLPRSARPPTQRA
jgi:capreomycidine synthase